MIAAMTASLSIAATGSTPMNLWTRSAGQRRCAHENAANQTADARARLDRSTGANAGKSDLGGQPMKDTANIVTVPDCLKLYAPEKRWVVWTWENRKDKSGNVKPTKKPFQAWGGVRGGYAQNDNPA